MEIAQYNFKNIFRKNILVSIFRIVRNQCKSVIYNEVINCVREKIGDSSMYVSIYEIIDVDSGYVANVLLSLVHDDKCFMSY